MEQISRRPDELQISSQLSGNEFTVGLINNNQMTRPYNSLQIMRNFDIANNGSLITRPGLTSTLDLNEFIDFDKLVGYRNSLTEVYKKSGTKKGYVELLSKSYATDGEYTLLSNSNPYDFIRIQLGSELFTFDKSVGLTNVTCNLTANKYIVFSISGNKLTLHEVHNTVLKSVNGVASNTDYDKLVDDSTARGIIEVATVIQGDEVNLYTRYSKVSLLDDSIISYGNWTKAGLISVIDTDQLDNFYNNKRLFMINNQSDVYVKTPEGLYKLVYINDGGTVGLTMASLMDEVSEERYKPNTSEITVNGYNVLSEFPENEIEDNADGVINGLQGIIVQGVEVNNRTQPFNVHKELLLRALVTYVRESEYESMKFKFSYDYIGSQYTNNFSFNKKEGEFPISDGYGEQSVNFTPNKVGMYRIYCQMALPNDDGDYEDSNFSTFHSFIDIQIELDNKTKNDVDEIYYYEAFKQSRIIRQWGDYYVVCGASQTTPYSSKIFISAPNNPSYFPTNYVQSLPSGTFVTDVVAYKGVLVILTNSGVYYISGDTPYSVAQLATDQSLEPFVVEKIVEHISAYYTDNIVATTDGVIMVADTIYKLFETTSTLNKIKVIGDSIIDMIPSTGFYFTQQIRDKTYFVRDDEVLIYETLDYNTYGVSGRYSFYHTHGLKVKDIFEELNQTFFVLETGQVCMLDKSSRGYDLEEPFVTEFKTNPNYFGNRNYPKKFKRLFYDILPINNLSGNHITYDDYLDIRSEDDIKDVEKQINFSMNVYLDNEQVINSMYVEATEMFGGGVHVERLHSPNMTINNDLFQMANKSEFVAFGKNEMYNIYGTDIVDWEQLDQIAYLAQVRLRGRGSHKSASVMLRFDSPVMIRGLGYDFKNRSVKGDYVGNQQRKNLRVRR